jgi:tetratricopeptide (TPR) repeat protein
MKTRTHNTLAAEAVRLAAVDHWKKCRYDEAFTLLDDFLKAKHVLVPEQELRMRSNLAMYERARGRFAEALHIHLDAYPLARLCRDPSVCGNFYHGLAVTKLYLGDIDGALIEFTGASACYEDAGEGRLRADVENNLAVLHAEAGRVEDALHHLALALGSCPDEAIRAQVDDTRALVELARHNPWGAVQSCVLSLCRLFNLDEPRLVTKSARTLVRAAREWGEADEAERIHDALRESGWNVTRAARRLGFNSRQALQNHLRRNFPAINEERRRRGTTVASRKK